MVNKSFLHNPQYHLTTHRTLSEATRDAQYACSIYAYEADSEPFWAASIIGSFIIGFALLAVYFDSVLAALK